VSVSLMCLALPVSADELVTNGGFETGNFTGWTDTGDTGFDGVDGNPHSGTFAGFFGPTNSNSFLTQDLPTITGGLYDLSFWLANDDTSGNNHFEVNWNGATIYSVDDAASFAYTQFFFNALAATGSPPTELQFGFYNPPSFWYLDVVSVVNASCDGARTRSAGARGVGLSRDGRVAAQAGELAISTC
jgi:hypothetical protein